MKTRKTPTLRIRLNKNNVVLLCAGRKVFEAPGLTDLNGFIQGWYGNDDMTYKSLRLVKTTTR